MLLSKYKSQLDNLDRLKEDLAEIENKYDKIQKRRFNVAIELSNLNGKIQPLIERIYVDDDVSGEAELTELNNQVALIKQFRAYSEPILKSLQREIQNKQEQIKQLMPIVTDLENRYQHWTREYQVAMNKLQRCTPLNYERVVTRVLEIAGNEYINDLEAASAAVDKRLVELGVKTGE